MCKVLVIPDSHLKIDVIERGVKLADKVRAEKIILLGDYFDDWYAMDSDYDAMLKYLKQLLRSRPTVEVLLGNHEMSYLTHHHASGYNRRVAGTIRGALANDHRFYYCISYDNVLYTHAGVCMSWIKANKVLTQNDIRFKLPKKVGAVTLEDGILRVEDPEVMCQVGPARGGYGYPSPLWADLTEVIADPAPVKQVVGHTPVKEITNIGKVWFVDVFSNGNESDEYLLVRDGEPETIHYKDYFNE